MCKPLWLTYWSALRRPPRKFARRYHSYFSLSIRARPRLKGLSQNELVDPGYDHKIEAWLVKVRRVTFLPRCAVSLFPAWGNCFKAGCLWRLSSFAWPRCSGFSCSDGSSIFGPSSTLRSSSLPHRRRTETPNKSSSKIRDARSQTQRACALPLKLSAI